MRAADAPRAACPTRMSRGCRLSEREQIVTAHRSIDVAESNLDGAKVARDEAKHFRASPRSELEAAQVAAGGGAQRRRPRARRRVTIARFAASRIEDEARLALIVVARQARLRRSARRAARGQDRRSRGQPDGGARRRRADQGAHRAAQRRRRRRATSATVRGRRQDAAERLAESRAHVAELEGETAQLKTAWDDRRHEMNRVASRGRDASAARAGRRCRCRRRVRPCAARSTTRRARRSIPAAQAPRNNIAPAP